MSRTAVLATAFMVLISSTVIVIAQERKDPPGAANSQPSAQDQQVAAAADTATSTSAPSADSATRRSVRTAVLSERAMRVEGEKRFQTNCGRCHLAPQKFPPRAMATIVRHMRVRAMLTDEDMRLILRYMTE